MANSNQDNCQTCSKPVTSISSRLVCQICNKNEHIVCLRLTSDLPTHLLGDTFFTLTCSKCSTTGRETIQRDKVNWLTAIIVAMYNLRKLSPHLGKEGFFHWKQHVAAFLEKNWIVLLGPQMKKSKTWLGTISGTLSYWSGDIFRSGLAVLKEPGWWSLVDERLPADLIASATANKVSSSKPNQSLLIKNKPKTAELTIQGIPFESYAIGSGDLPKGTRGVQSSIKTAMALKEKRATLSEAKDIRKAQQQLTTLAPARTPQTSPGTSLLISSVGPKSIRQTQQFGFSPPSAGDSMITSNSRLILKTTTSPTQSAFLSNSLEVNLDSKCSFDDAKPPKMIKVEKEDALVSTASLLDDFLPLFDGMEFVDLGIRSSGPEIGPLQFSMDEMISTSRDSLPNVEDLVSGLGNTDEDPVANNLHEDNNSSCGEDETIDHSNVPPSQKEVQKIQFPQSNCKPLCRYGEEKLLKKLENNPDLLSKDLSAKLLRRKLKVRQQLRKAQHPIFDFDNVVQRLAAGATTSKLETSIQPQDLATVNSHLLDRFQISKSEEHKSLSLRDRLLGKDPFDLQCVTSPFTKRVLKPIIRQDFKIRPPKLKLFDEMSTKVSSWESTLHFPIDFVYVRPHHIPIVNQLAAEFFWEGIDLSECLQYPDFSCVVVYRKIVVAFAFLVPNVSHTEAYVTFIFTHPDWRRVGIAKFMLYHLCQTCMGKDITLHVSANNPAVLLYQKFGFKVEEYVQNFYDKYLPVDSTECKHALFLRLSRC